jgi:hypothetical protein
VVAVDGHHVRAQRIQRQLARVHPAHEHPAVFRIDAPNQEIGDSRGDLGILGDHAEELAVGDVEPETRQWSVTDAELTVAVDGSEGRRRLTA